MLQFVIHFLLFFRTILLFLLTILLHFPLFQTILKHLLMLNLTIIPSIIHFLLLLHLIIIYIFQFHSLITILFGLFYYLALYMSLASYPYHYQPILNPQMKALIHHFTFYYLLFGIFLSILDL